MNRLCIDEAIGIVKEIDTSKMEHSYIFDEAIAIVCEYAEKQMQLEFENSIKSH